MIVIQTAKILSVKAFCLFVRSNATINKDKKIPLIKITSIIIECISDYMHTHNIQTLIFPGLRFTPCWYLKASLCVTGKIQKLWFPNSALYFHIRNLPCIIQNAVFVDHLPGHNYPEHPVAGVFIMTAWCILLSPLFFYVTLKSGFLIAASVMHGSLNGTVGIGIMMLEAGNDMMVGSNGLAGFVALTGFILLLYLYDR